MGAQLFLSYHLIQKPCSQTYLEYCWRKKSNNVIILGRDQFGRTPADVAKVTYIERREWAGYQISRISGLDDMNTGFWQRSYANFLLTRPDTGYLAECTTGYFILKGWISDRNKNKSILRSSIDGASIDLFTDPDPNFERLTHSLTHSHTHSIRMSINKKYLS